MTTAFGSRIKRARTHAGFTQKQLAAASGVRQSTLSELETIAHRSSFTAQIAAACRVNAHWLATGENEENWLDATATPPAPPPRATMTSTLHDLANQVATTDEVTREAIAPLLRRLLSHPEEADSISARVEALLAAEARAERITRVRLAQHTSETDLYMFDQAESTADPRTKSGREVIASTVKKARDRMLGRSDDDEPPPSPPPPAAKPGPARPGKPRHQ